MSSKPTLRQYATDEEYIAAQDRHSSWNHNSGWGEQSEANISLFGRLLADQLFHDDSVADFGGNDGTSAYQFYRLYKIKPLVVDCEPKRLEYAARVYKLPTYQTFIEHMPELRDKSIDWGYCSNALEHLRDPELGLREMARVVKRGCYFVNPLEHKGHAVGNEAHTICFTTTQGWVRFMKQHGWSIKSAQKPVGRECHIFAEPE